MTAPDDARVAFAAWNAAVSTNWYDADPHLQSLVNVLGIGHAAPALQAFGATSAALDPLIRENNRDEHLPRLRRYDGQGHRVEAVDFHPLYHQIGRAVYATGLMSRYAQPGHEAETLAFLYLFSQNGEAGHACPIACTAGMVKILQAAGGGPAGWLDRLLDADYDTHFHGAQWLTEVQGGSDVGANALRAREGDDGAWRIYGEKWFCSVIDAHLFLLTARPEGERAGTAGLRTFIVPRALEDGRTNDFAIRRLKFKLGTRSMASAEVDFHGAVAVPVGDFRTTVDLVLNTSRLYNAICSCGTAQRAAREALHYARNRVAFGRPILDYPTLARIVARLRVTAYAARGLTFQLAALADRAARGEASDVERGALRMLVNLNKFWTSVQGTTAAREAIEVLGGNGAIEEFSVLPRLLRDGVVCEAWEGGHNVLCLQAYKDSQRLGLHTSMFAWLRALGGDTPALRRAEQRWAELLAMPPGQALIHVRDAAELLGPAAQAAALRSELTAGGTDADLPVVIEHLEVTTAPDYDAFTDPTLLDRVTALVTRAT